MLTSLSISNIVLIEKLNLEFGRGLNVLTGETGAGKSILLDALSLALGGRSDANLVRHGCEVAQVGAEFDAVGGKLKSILSDNGIDFDGSLILRRTLTADGKSRAWVNDVPVSVKTLKQIGDELVEIHGQFENHSLLDQTTHRMTLDEFAVGNSAEYSRLLIDVKNSYAALNAAEKKLEELSALMEKSAMEREFLGHNAAELTKLAPKVGEEEELSNRRALLMNAEKNSAILSEALQKSNGLDSQIFSVARILERIKTEPNPYKEQIAKLYEAADIISAVSEKLAPVDSGADNVEDVEERLFAIRAAARKHRCAADELPDKLIQISSQLEQLDNSDAELKKLKSEAKIKKSEFDAAALKLTQERVAAAEILRKQILGELPDLKLGQADFKVEISPRAPSGAGADEILFMIKTNPGSSFAPLHKIASGGELSRLMLALRVVLSNDGSGARSFIFDEVDAGISGATAQAVGERLNRLAAGGQALVITHSAQVAGFADKHFKIEKTSTDTATHAKVSELADDARISEVARIISGEKITSESIATAKTLIK
ncbi:MAG: DNA repair protein RecN [Rickettsiales bacterium]|jgi:DNA repair protein RecN (Recombination protein N)|nr:DNA repair protein RecN [Rickettsiales bacterium]